MKQQGKTTGTGIKGSVPSKKLIWIAVAHWILTFFTDNLIFSYVRFDLSDGTQMVKTAMTYGAKAVFLLLLMALYQVLYRFFTRADRSFAKYTLLYFAVNMVCLILVWPGIFRMDEFGILNSAVQLLPVFWQNYLTSLFYVFSLMLLPVPSGIIIVQCALISPIAGYLVNSAVKRFGRAGLLVFVPCFFLPVLDSNLYPMRMSLYAFLEVLLILLLYQRYRAGKGESGPDARLVCLLAAVVTVWRTEAVYYFVLFPLLWVILYLKKEGKRSVCRMICGYLVCVLVLFVPQRVGDKLTSGNQYDLTSVVLPLVPLAAEAAERGECKEALAAIDGVVNVELLLEGAAEGKSGISLFWSREDFQRTGYTDEQYGAFKSAYYSLIRRYPSVFLAERWDCFVHSTDLLQNTTELFTAENVPNYDRFRSYPLTAPLNNALRSGVVKLLEWRKADYDSKRAGYGVIYSGIPPVIILLLCWGVCLIKRRWKVFFLLSLPLAKLPLIFLTAPSRLFMYYYSLYLLGYLLLAFVLLLFWQRVKGSVQKTLRYAKRNGAKEAYLAVKERLDWGGADELSRLAAAYEGNRRWSEALTKEALEAERRRQKENIKKHAFLYNPLISIVVPAYETKETFIRELADSVRQQTYGNWELLVADAGRSGTVKSVITELAGRDDRIRYLALEENRGISGNTNAALSQAAGEYIALLDHDDLLTQDALYRMVEKLNQHLTEKSAENRHADMLPRAEEVAAVYSDEDKCDGGGTRFYEPHWKPDFNLDLLLCNNYICHFLVVRAELMKELGLREAYDGAQDYDLVLRIAERCLGREEADGVILHVPAVLYHWRCHEASTAGNTESKRYAYDAGLRALTDFYRRNGIAVAEVKDGRHLGFYETRYASGALDGGEAFDEGGTPDGTEPYAALFDVRRDVAAVCGLVVKGGSIVGGPVLQPGAGCPFIGMKQGYGGYFHRAHLRFDACGADSRALLLRKGLSVSLEEALSMGMRLVFDPAFIVNEA